MTRLIYFVWTTYLRLLLYLLHAESCHMHTMQIQINFRIHTAWTDGYTVRYYVKSGWCFFYGIWSSQIRLLGCAHWSWTALSPYMARGKYKDLAHFMSLGLGYYLYTEASGANPGTTADLLSPILTGGIPYCFSLATNMYGAGMGSVEILVQVVYICYANA